MVHVYLQLLFIRDEAGFVQTFPLAVGNPCPLWGRANRALLRCLQPPAGRESSFLRALLPSGGAPREGSKSHKLRGVLWGTAGTSWDIHYSFSFSKQLGQAYRSTSGGHTVQLCSAEGTKLPPRPVGYGVERRSEDMGLGLALPGPTPAPPSVQGSSCLHTGGQPGAWWPGHTASWRSPCPPGCDTR